MKIEYHRKFKKQFKKLSIKDKEKVIWATSLFLQNPLDKRLKNHALQGTLKGWRSIWVASDLRIVFEEFDNYILVIFLDLGNHNRVYR